MIVHHCGRLLLSREEFSVTGWRPALLVRSVADTLRIKRYVQVHAGQPINNALREPRDARGPTAWPNLWTALRTGDGRHSPEGRKAAQRFETAALSIFSALPSGSARAPSSSHDD
jgi:hypothetical protein